MSVSSCLLLCLLYLCLHASNGRRLAAFDTNVEKKFHISNQSEIKKEISVAQELETSFSSSNQVVLGESTEDDKAHEKLNKILKTKKKLVKNDVKPRKKSASVDQNESVGSVSWRVPKTKRGEKHPGFNLDYSPPKTHPPSHN